MVLGGVPKNWVVQLVRNPPNSLNSLQVHNSSPSYVQKQPTTANIPTDPYEAVLETSIPTGIYYGWAQLKGEKYKMVMSIGWNPFYKNSKKTIEVHLLHHFPDDFYGEPLRILVLGYLRPEANFSSLGWFFFSLSLSPSLPSPFIAPLLYPIRTLAPLPLFLQKLSRRQSTTTSPHQGKNLTLQRLSTPRNILFFNLTLPLE
jgi:hypothetical protein